ncbi:DUF7350 domain-containing protein [Halobacterium jilantaiense]|uniref:DUF7350 domain-containing protein n=1 Tax=Halobacterium jilantaiense TaxID=355548 RepID=A0A1I0N6S3_9EURY|nr:hypothetical protein [Halobacterium jilantaiense]SEV96360.1 hypothetical protein SAMN04487945_0622 [Halobacterium jilantaiense]
MRRRRFLAGLGASGLAASAGCLGFLETEPANREPPLPENRPDEPYYPTHYEGMEMAGTSANGRYRAMLSYTFPHRFWTVTGEETERVDFESSEDAHLMVSVWDDEAGVALPATSPRIEYTNPDGETGRVNPWQMLSQRMGVHYGDNVELGPDGDYEATVQVSPGGTRRTDDVQVPDGPLTFSFSFPFSQGRLNDLEFTDIAGDREGTPGAVDPMGMDAVSAGQTPAAESFPLEVRGTQTAAGAEFVAATADERGTLATGSDETYVAVSVRSAHSRFPLAAATLSLDAAGDTHQLVPTLDPELGYHYAAAVPGLGDGDALTVRQDAASQLARHEGYETAFFGVDPMEF